MVEPHSKTWAAVEEQAKRIIEGATFRAIQSGVEERVADFERGRIAAVKDILKLAEASAAAERVKVKADRTGYF